jgi:phosphate transport system protein
MPRSSLDDELIDINRQLLAMGQMVNTIMIQAMEDLRTGDIEAARVVYQQDLIINDKRFQIQAHAIVMIALQQPMARDLRALASILVVTSELERMGDYGKEIALICIRLGNRLVPHYPQSLFEMAQKSTSMLTRALNAFVRDDLEAALNIHKQNDEVDVSYMDIYRELMNSTIRDARLIESVNLILWAAHNLERMADRVTNICERTQFIVTGEL